MNRSVLSALVAAALFGASTPFAKPLSGEIPPALLAGLMYLGSGSVSPLSVRFGIGAGSRAAWPAINGPGSRARSSLAACLARLR